MLDTFTRQSDFVPASLDASSWSQLKPLYRLLIERPIPDARSLERLILDRSELDAAVSETGSVLHINMTCHTDDEATTKAYLDFVEHVQPQLKEVSFELDRRIVASPFCTELDQARYGVLLRDLRVGEELFRSENVPLETELTKLDQEYSQVLGSMMVEYRGKTLTMQQMARYQEETDRAVREETWRAMTDRRAQDRERLETIFETMLRLRHQIAINAGFANYRDYMHKAKRRFDYSPEDCASFAEGVERHVVPALRAINIQRAAAMKLDRLRPWDLAVDIHGRGPLRPFADAEDLVARTQRVFNRMDPSLGDMFAVLRVGVGETKCLDLESRKGKAPGGYQASRDRIRVPFIFMNAAGLQRDVETMVHEAGHAFHSLLCRNDPLVSYRSDIPLEFCEVASMAMELTSHPFLDEFYTKADADRARRNHLEGIATLLPWIATIDQYQQWLYTHVGHSRSERAAAWNRLMDRFGSEVDWTGLESHRSYLWQRQQHLFSAPFYYIEYGIAQLGALELFACYKRNPVQAIDAYKRGLSLGGSRPLPELFKAAGINLDFSPQRIDKTWSEIERSLQTLPA